jgi:hypothetical protein
MARTAHDVTDPTCKHRLMQLLERFGARADRRMTPRVGISLAGTGVLLAIGGSIGLATDDLVGDEGDINRIPGLVVALVLLGVGFVVLQRIRSGPIATGASVAAAVGIPLLLFFATVRDSYPGFNVDAVLLLAAVGWAVAYLVGPARGRVFFLALALIATPLFVLEQVEDVSDMPRAAFEDVRYAFVGDSSIDGAPEPPEHQYPDPTTIGLILLVFGAVYAGLSRVLSGIGHDGVATPFAPLGVFGVVLGISFLADDLGDVFSGALLAAFGIGITFVGAMAARRFTTWAGAVMTAYGIGILVAEALGDGASRTTTSIVFVLAGLAVVFAAHLLVALIGESGEEDQRRSLRNLDAPRAGREPGPPPADEMWAPPTP